MSELVVIAQIAGRRIAIDAARVSSVVDLADIVRVPGTADYILGVTALRSRPMTVIDTCLAIGQPGDGDPAGARALVIENDGHHYALLVEDVFDVAEVQGEPMPVPGELNGDWNRIGIALVETGNQPALLIEPTALLCGPHREAA
ncbi:chemotaxis protein CheW [Altererythrobacter sp. MF3-039]|uniref:chemotaxis protein CheW n=1 Tax=Altererythrobacter sp. MF3-039 TaxID=3252901 RepID=UPI00390C8E4D